MTQTEPHIRFNDGQHAQTHDAVATKGHKELIIRSAQSDKVLARWPLNAIRMAHRLIDGVSGEFVCDGFEDQQLLVGNRQAFDTIVGYLPHRKRVLWKPVLTVLATLLVMLGSVFFLVPYAAAYIATVIPLSVEQQIGKSVLQHMAPEKTRCSTAAGEAALQKLLQRLDAPDGTQVFVKSTSMQNAYTLPGGYVVLLSGMLRQMESPEELAGVLAHEIAHAKEKHGMKTLIRTATTGFLIDMFTGGGGTLLYAGTFLYNMSYSRTQEAEADELALLNLQQQKIDPTGFARFFERMDARYQKLKDKMGLKEAADLMQLVSTHPASQDRMQAALAQKQNSPVAYQAVMGDGDWQAIRTICSPARSLKDKSADAVAQ